MKLHLLGGVKLPNLKKELTREIKKIGSRLLLVGALLAMIPTGVIAAPISPASPLLTFDATALRISFDTHDMHPLETVDLPTITFAIGESKVQEQARLTAQAARRVRITKQSTTVTTRATEPDFSSKRVLAQRAAATYGIPWEVLEAVWQVESGKSWDTGTRSHAGAQGPAQFMPATWRHYGVDGNGDGVADITSAEDAVYGAAHYLAANGADRGDIYHALLAYNHADWYVQKVLKIAREIGYTA